MSANGTLALPKAVHAASRPTRTARSRFRRLYVRICRKLRPIREVAAFFGAALSAVFELFSGRLPSFSPAEVSCPPDPEPRQTADSPLAPYPVHD